MRRPRPLALSALVLALAATAAACSGSNPTVVVSGDARSDASPANIAAFLAADEEQRFTTLLDCVTVAGAAAAVTGSGPVTLFAPTNDAFRRAGVDCDPEAEADPEAAAELLRTLQQHVVDYDVRFTTPEGYDPENPPRLTEIVERGSITLDSILLDAEGTALEISADKTVTVEGTNAEAKIIDADLQAPNGLVQVIDRVLTPPEKEEFPPATSAPQPFE
ncbi:MAG: fasciclin domain-containing protein [Acidimicrobiales bacterium]